jgi:hypothetical protein
MQKPVKTTQPIVPQNSDGVVLKPEAPRANPAPATNTAKPDKNVEVPKYCVCMGSDPTVDPAVIHALLRNKDAE